MRVVICGAAGQLGTDLVKTFEAGGEEVLGFDLDLDITDHPLVMEKIPAFHPDLVVLGGGVAGIGSLLFDTVRDALRSRVRMFPVDDIRIERSLLGERAGMLGGIALAMQGGLIRG